MCSRPRKPQRKPKPSAADVSGSKVNDASFSRSFSSASRSSRVLAGLRPGRARRRPSACTSLKPGNGSGVGRAASVIVSPICASRDGLDVGDDEADLADAELVARRSASARTRRPRRPRTPGRCAISRIFMPGADGAVDDAHQDDRRRGRRRTSESKISALSGASAIARRRRQPVRRSPRGSRGRRCPPSRSRGWRRSASRPMISSICRLASSGCAPGQVDLVDDRDDLEVVVDREVGVGERLRLDALRRVDDEQRALARRERPRDLVGEVDVAGRVDQVEDVRLAVVRRVVEPDRRAP